MAGIEDFELPKAIIARLIKASLPESIAVQKDSKLAVTKASTVFINYVASTANEIARKSGHKTIMAPDVLKALKVLNMEDFVSDLEAELEEHKRLVKEKKESKAAQNVATGASDQKNQEPIEGDDKDEDEEGEAEEGEDHEAEEDGDDDEDESNEQDDTITSTEVTKKRKIDNGQA